MRDSQHGALEAFARAIEQLKTGSTAETEAGSSLAASFAELVRVLQDRQEEMLRLEKITARINSGLTLDEVLENVYRDFQELIPYNRIGLSLITADGQNVVARWAKSDRPDLLLQRGYQAPLRGSSLETIMVTGRPRILNDLEEYLRYKPGSEPTRLILQEGIRASLTCPLIANGKPVGFLFFSSSEPDTYRSVHLDTYLKIAEQLSVIVEKARLVSEIAAQKEAIEDQNRELMRLNEAKNTLLGMAAHDLRNPIGMAKVISLRLKEETETPREQREFLLDYVIRQTTHALHLLDNLLDTSHIESGKLTLRKEKIDLHNFLKETVERHSMLAAPKETSVVLSACDPGMATADSFRLRQVLDNLVSNAVKFSPLGSMVQVSAHRKDAWWEIHVRDQGPGISEDDRKHLFQYFTRLSATPTGAEKSSGLGLAISQRIIQAHGGIIHVQPAAGHGADFWFTLPE